MGRARTLAMAKRMRTLIRAVLGFAEGRGWVERNVAPITGACACAAARAA